MKGGCADFPSSLDDDHKPEEMELEAEVGRPYPWLPLNIYMNLTNIISDWTSKSIFFKP